MPPRSADPLAVLREVFALPSFRPGQAEVVEAQLEGRDVLSVAPTGAGKSISYWVPAVILPGLTLIVSPLIALMKDQVDRLREHGVAAAFVNSSLERSVQVRTLDEAREGRLQLLYVAPERLSRPGFLARLGGLPVVRVVVDEAHCISSWGHDFRPDYRLLGAAVEACGRPPVAAFTATATPRVRDDIVASLGLRRPAVFVSGFNRPNLHLSAVRCRGEAARREALAAAIDPGAGRALVYAGTRASAEAVAALLAARGLRAEAYHAGLGDDRRRAVQEAFAGGAVRVVVATTAFGMGVDVADVRQVIHVHLPGSVEAYYQEAGRAGRDGLPARCILLWSPADRDLHAHFIATSGLSRPDLLEAAHARVQQMAAYARLRTCRHARIADYFGEAGVPRTCSACDNCLNPDQARGEPVGQADLALALGAAQRLSGRVGAANVAAFLAGRESGWSRRNPWVAGLPQYGSLRWPLERLRELIEEMTEAGLVRQSAGEYPVVDMTPLGSSALRGEVDVEVVLPGRPPATAPRTATTAAAAGAAPETIRTLRAWRLEVARRDGVPPYVVLHDRTLMELAARRPATPAELASVPGIGPAKLERHGAALLELLREP